MRSEYRRWVVLGAQAVVLLFTFPAIFSTIGVFMMPLIHRFGWTRAEVSRVATSFALGHAVFSLAAGWLVDFVDVGVVVGSGALLTALGCFLAGRANSLTGLILSYLISGSGTSLTGLVTMAAAVINWFPKHRSTAMGSLLISFGLSSLVWPLLITAIISHRDWRAGYLATGAGLVLLAAPVGFALIRTRPAQSVSQSNRTSIARGAARDQLPGLELGPALLTSGVWLLFGVMFLSSVASLGFSVHTIPYLIGKGYSPQAAARAAGFRGSLGLIFAVLVGLLADRFGRKRLLVACSVVIGLSNPLVLLSGNYVYGGYALAVWVIFGVFGTAYLILIPVLVEDVAGPRRFGTLWGIVNGALAIGQGVGPLAMGWLFDLTGSYVPAVHIATVAYLAAGLLALGIIPARGHDQVLERAETLAV